MKKSEQKKLKRGVIYARYSSNNQREESIEQQVDECTAFAAQNDIEVTEIYADKAISGRTDKRLAFQRMMRDAEKRKFEVVVAYKSSRIARNMLNAMQTENKLEGFGIQTLYAREEFGQNPTGRFALRMMMNVNQFYSENMSEDIKRGMGDNAKNGKVNGPLPYGYINKDGFPEVNEQEAAIIREIYRRILAGEPQIDIVNDLNARGLKARRGPWNRNSFVTILKNRSYIGEYRNSGVVIAGGMPAILTEEEFNAMQEYRQANNHPHAKKESSADYILTGKLICGDCNEWMVGISGTSKTGAMHHYYSCQGKRKAGCKKSNVKKDWIERKVLDLTAEYVLQPDVIEWIADAAVEYQRQHYEDYRIDELKDAIAEAKRKRDNLMAAIADGAKAQIFYDEVETLGNTIETNERELRKREASQVPIDRERIIYELEKFRLKEDAEPAFQKQFINTFVKAIYLWDDKIRIDYFYTGKNGPVKSLSRDEEESAGMSSYEDCSAVPHNFCTNSTEIIITAFHFSLIHRMKVE